MLLDDALAETERGDEVARLTGRLVEREQCIAEVGGVIEKPGDPPLATVPDAIHDAVSHQVVEHKVGAGARDGNVVGPFEGGASLGEGADGERVPRGDD